VFALAVTLRKNELGYSLTWFTCYH